MEAKAQLNDKYQEMFWAIKNFYGVSQKSEAVRICIKKTFMQIPPNAPKGDP